MCWRQFLAAGMLGGTLIAMPWAGSASEPDDAELKAIRAAATDYISALERGDAEAVAEAWTDDGDYVDAVGRTFKAREIIASQFAGGGKARPLQVTVDQVRLISPAVAIEDGCVVHGGPSGDAALCSRYSAVWVKKDDGWRLDSLRESLPPAPPRNPQLSELAWLLGEFTGLADDDSQIIVSATISRDGNYILREISVTHPSEGSRSFSQRIGWDPLCRAFKCWTFDADGGHSVGVWKRQGDSWIVNTDGVLPDGRQSSATNVYSEIDERGFVFDSVGATVDGKLHPDMKAKLSRHAREE